MKYVIFNQNGLMHPVLFADHTSHTQIALEGSTAVSAGFVRFKGLLNEPECYGHSTSLKLDSRPKEDAEIIRRWQQNLGTSSFIDYDSL